MISYARLTFVKCAAILLLLTLAPIHKAQAQDEPSSSVALHRPDNYAPLWAHEGPPRPRPLAPKDVGPISTLMPLEISDAERQVIHAALMKKEDGPLGMVKAALQRIGTGQPITLGDAIIINSALMFSDNPLARPFLKRMRRWAAEQVK